MTNSKFIQHLVVFEEYLSNKLRNEWQLECARKEDLKSIYTDGDYVFTHITNLEQECLIILHRLGEYGSQLEHFTSEIMHLTDRINALEISSHNILQKVTSCYSETDDIEIKLHQQMLKFKKHSENSANLHLIDKDKLTQIKPLSSYVIEWNDKINRLEEILRSTQTRLDDYRVTKNLNYIYLIGLSCKIYS